MKAFIVGLAVVALASADVSHLDTVRDADGYHYKQPAPGSGPFSEGFGQLGGGRPQRPQGPQQEYLPPTNQNGSPSGPSPTGPFGTPGGPGPSGQPSFGGSPQGPGATPQHTTPSLIHRPQPNAPGSGPQQSGCGFGASPGGPCGANQPGPSGPTGQGPQQEYLPPTGGSPSAPGQSPFSPSAGSPSFPSSGQFGPTGGAPSHQGPGSFGPGSPGSPGSPSRPTGFGSSPSYQAPGSLGPGGGSPSYQAPGSFGPSPSAGSPYQTGGSLAGGRHPGPTNEYIPPVRSNDVEPAHTLKEDGYHYKNPNF